MWTTDKALALIRTLQPLAKHAGYHLGLAGGVLNKGHSSHDLDITVMPLSDDHKTRNLDGLWRACRLVGQIDAIEPFRAAYPHSSHEVWRGHMIETSSPRRVIDFFVFEHIPFLTRVRRWATRMWASRI